MLLALTSTSPLDSPLPPPSVRPLPAPPSELVCDKEGAGAPPVWRLLAYDVLAIGGKPLTKMPLHKRMALIGKEVINPRKHPTHASAVAAEALRVRQKDCFRLKHVGHLLRKFIPKLSHPAKGLVFLEAEAPFTAGTVSSALDWYSQAGAGGGVPGGGVPEPELLAFADAHFK